MATSQRGSIPFTNEEAEAFYEREAGLIRENGELLSSNEAVKNELDKFRNALSYNQGESSNILDVHTTIYYLTYLRSQNDLMILSIN